MTSAAPIASRTAPRTATPVEIRPRTEPAEARTAGRYQLLGGLQVADVATTWVILANFTTKAEGNPIVAAIIDHTGLQVSMVALLLMKLAIVYVLYRKQTGVNIMSAIYGLVVFNNLLALGLALSG